MRTAGQRTYRRCLDCNARWVQELTPALTACPEDEWLAVVGPDPLPPASIPPRR
ncbi:MAG: hypothetical protein K8W52_47185 [Deltaproteobacteria bacterium]|nr:hypothetical protein [Deltaproteobacteria bacterium]